MGRLTFRGTRVFVVAVLKDVANGLSYYSIVSRWHGLPEDALAEAVRVACDALLQHWKELLVTRAKRMGTARKRR